MLFVGYLSLLRSSSRWAMFDTRLMFYQPLTPCIANILTEKWTNFFWSSSHSNGFLINFALTSKFLIEKIILARNTWSYSYWKGLYTMKHFLHYTSLYTRTVVHIKIIISNDLLRGIGPAGLYRSWLSILELKWHSGWKVIFWTRHYKLPFIRKEW